MYVINARNVNDALVHGISLINTAGQELDSRGGKTLEVPFPVSTVYNRPWERVIMNPTRDANPFFHMMEALWILAGRYDVKFLTEFNKRMGEYSDDGNNFNAAYGYRLRHGVSITHDQILKVIKILSDDLLSRQAVCQIWDEVDLDKNTKDKACNMSLVFRVRNDRLCLTVYNRSNDMIWGAYGANAVQFSMILEYVAAHLDIQMGTYTQVSNSYHVYTEGPGGELWDKLKGNPVGNKNTLYCNNPHLIFMNEQYNNIDKFDNDLVHFFNNYDALNLIDASQELYQSAYFNHLVIPMLECILTHKRGDTPNAILLSNNIQANDWRIACKEWLERRMK